MHYYNRIVFLLITVIMGFQSQAQDTEPSPWSRFGLGLNTPVYSSPQSMMGGVSSPLINSGVINPDQPASAAGATTTLFQTSVNSSRNNMTDGDSTATITSGAIGAMGLVIKKPGGKTALMMGMTPNTAKGYNITRTFENETLGEIAERYTGYGGTARSYLGMARAFHRKTWLDAGNTDSVYVTRNSLYLGAQLNYLFGEVVQTSRLDIQDITFLDNRTSTKMRHRSLAGLFGVQATQLLYAKYDDEKNFQGAMTLALGGTYSTEANLYTDYVRIVETVQLLSQVETPVDTTYYADITDSPSRLPSKWTAGGALTIDMKGGMKLVLAADLMREDWTSVADDFSVDILGSESASWAAASRTSFGLSLKPKNGGSSAGALTRSTYSAGFEINEYPIAYDGNQLAGWRAAAGISIPLEGSRSNSSLHFGIDYGKRGLVENGTILENSLNENLFNVQVGFSLSPFFKNLWLTPRLYD